MNLNAKFQAFLQAVGYKGRVVMLDEPEEVKASTAVPGGVETFAAPPGHIKQLPLLVVKGEEPTVGHDMPIVVSTAEESLETKLETSHEEGKKAGIAYAHEIVSLCSVANKPALAVTYIHKGLSVEEARQDLNMRRVAEEETINSYVDPLAKKRSVIDTKEIYRKLNAAVGQA